MSHNRPLLPVHTRLTLHRTLAAALPVKRFVRDSALSSAVHQMMITETR
jgi:hypothetical protein